jgi:transglutaminase-like putative cysteine protease
MGGAYSSIADDASAIFWNPAGLPWIGHQEISGTHADLFGTGIQDNLASFALPLSPNSAAAVDWYHSGFDDTELGFSESRIDLGYGRRVMPFLSVGANVKYLSRSTELDGASVRSGSGIGFDVGAIATPLSRARVGVVAQDLFDTNVSYSDGMGTATAIPMSFRAGASYSPLRGAIVSFDVDDRWHLGVEGRLLEVIALRGGLQDDWSGPDGMAWSAGAGIKVGLFRFDYALVEHPVLGSTSNFGLAMEFNFNPAHVRIEKVEPRDLFASLYKTYTREPVAVVRVRNLDDRPLEAKLRVLIPGVMDTPTEQTVVLRPRATEDLPVTAVIPERVIGHPGNRSVQVEVTATYQSAHLPRTEKASAKAIVYAPGAIDWGRGVDQAAAYVTVADPAVGSFAREATRIASLSQGETPAQRNITHAAAIVDALASIGFAYVPDPNNPYSAISETPRAVDTIAYPRESLRRRSGDCDDSTVLLAALLENVGIATRFLDVPGHIFMMMDTGVHERNRVALGVDDDLTVVSDERVWIPLETTSVRKGFAQAWTDGAESYASWAARGRVSVVDVASSMARYEPSVPGTVPLAADVLDPATLRPLLAADLDTLREWREAHLRTLFHGATADGAPAVGAAMEVARAYYSAGKWTEARARLDAVLAANPRNAAALNNLGNVLAASGDLGAAAARYQESLAGSDGDPGTWLNLGLVRYAMGDTAGAAQPIAEGVTRSGGLEQACALIGLSPDLDATAREGARRMSEAEARALLMEAMRKVPSPGASAPAPKTASDKPVTSRPWTSRVAAGRSAERMALHDHLYWKER